MPHGELRIDYMPLSSLIRAPRNPKDHDIGQIDTSMNRWGYTAPVTVDERTGRLVAGHGRLETLVGKQGRGDSAPSHIREERGEWLVPVIRGLSFNSDADAEAYLVADNRLTELGGWNTQELADVLSSWEGELAFEGVGYDRDDLDSMLHDLDNGAFDAQGNEHRKPSTRNLPLDLIYCADANDLTCCLAMQAGWKYGFSSLTPRKNREPCHMTHFMGERHLPVFMDNDYTAYDHDWHVKKVAKHRPKYATVRDAMTKAQCSEAGIEFFSLSRVLEFADEVSEHAEEVIIIPKYDCLDEIPERYILGYSVPSRHGNTPLAPEAFSGRRVHLLGGSWKQQMTHMAILGEDVVSIDHNQALLLATRFGQWIDGEGETHSLAGMGVGTLNNPRYAALALSLGCIAGKVNEIAGSAEPASEALTNESGAESGAETDEGGQLEPAEVSR